MALPVELDPRAEEEARAAFLWHSERSERAAAAFEREFESAIEQIGERPDAYPVADGQLRRFLLHRFPYAIFYAIGAMPDVTRAPAAPLFVGALERGA
jgi:plasmid stabilization system protein ParE